MKFCFIVEMYQISIALNQNRYCQPIHVHVKLTFTPESLKDFHVLSNNLNMISEAVPHAEQTKAISSDDE